MTETTHAKPKYGMIFLALFALTAIEVFIAGLPIPDWMIVAGLIAFAILKAALVAAFYMHLKFEKILLVVIALAPLIFSVILVVLVGADIASK